ncbi:hypothetical protein [Rhodoferax sp.]|uniref:dioxygenase family protein n=1 Tax=Rhodoferax sp. TaxID=50421 RepID=UPI00374D52A9
MNLSASVAPHPASYASSLEHFAESQRRLQLSTDDICVVSTVETTEPSPLALAGSHRLRRRDITEGKAGIPVMLTLQLVDYENRCAAINGAEVYVWHCDAEGIYSGDHSGPYVTADEESFLRGVQFSNSAGLVSFKTILPGCYQCQLEHIHVQVLLPSNVPSSRTVLTASAQLYFPYAVTTAAYSNSMLYRPTLNSDRPTQAVAALPLPSTGNDTLSVSGNASSGYAASMVIGISSR